jgi:hypothetical protein
MPRAPAWASLRRRGKRLRTLVAGNGAPGARLRATRCEPRKSRPIRQQLQIVLGPRTAGELPLSGFFYVARSRARIAVRGGRYARLIASRAAAGGRPLGSTPTDPRSGSVLQLFAHAIELCCVIRTEPPALLGRPLTMTSTPTTHRSMMIARSTRTLVPCTLICAGAGLADDSFWRRRDGSPAGDWRVAGARRSPERGCRSSRTRRDRSRRSRRSRR